MCNNWLQAPRRGQRHSAAGGKRQAGEGEVAQGQQGVSRERTGSPAFRDAAAAAAGATLASDAAAAGTSP
jgi:hypothetical protein